MGFFIERLRKAVGDHKCPRWLQDFIDREEAASRRSRERQRLIRESAKSVETPKPMQITKDTREAVESCAQLICCDKCPFVERK
jgi:hypothetical protein